MLLNKARQVAEFSGALRDPAFRHRLATLEIDLLAFSAFYRHAAALHASRQGARRMAPVIKIAGGELGQRASELLVDAAGPASGRSADDLAIGNTTVQSGRRPVRDAPRHRRQRRGRDPAQHHRQARAWPAELARPGMELLLSEPQSLFAATAARLARPTAGRGARALRDAGTEIDADAWGETIEAGWLGMVVAEVTADRGSARSIWRCRSKRPAASC